MGRKIIYVSSFASDMYQASGKRLIETFVSTKTPGSLLCFTEGFELVGAPPGVLGRAITNDPILLSFLKDNKDVIPAHLGGEHLGCTCPDGPFGPHSKQHIQPCVGHWFNRNSSRWFRKILAMYRALEHSADILVWLDSDCIFKKRLPAEIVTKIFRAKAVFYMKSNKREVIESGIMGFFLGRGGKLFIQKTMDRYRSQEFRRYPRWDDSYQWQVTRDENAKKISTIDIAATASGHGDVAKHSLLKDFLEHQKGTHGRGLGIMT